MTPAPIETILLPKIKQLEALQLQSHHLQHEPTHPIHAKVQQTFNELMEILKDIPAFRYPLGYRVKFPRTH
jgi:hypothetical protein